MSHEFSEEFRQGLEEKGFLITSDIEFTDIPFCMCCDFETMKKLVDQKPPQELAKKGRLLLGVIPFCRTCENKCSPEESKCQVNEKTGRKITMSEVTDWVMT